MTRPPRYGTFLPTRQSAVSGPDGSTDRAPPRDTGTDSLLDSHTDDVIKVPWDQDAVLADMDYPEDYRRELDRIRDLS